MRNTEESANNMIRFVVVIQVAFLAFLVWAGVKLVPAIVRLIDRVAT